MKKIKFSKNYEKFTCGFRSNRPQNFKLSPARGVILQNIVLFFAASDLNPNYFVFRINRRRNVTHPHPLQIFRQKCKSRPEHFSLHTRHGAPAPTSCPNLFRIFSRRFSSFISHSGGALVFSLLSIFSLLICSVCACFLINPSYFMHLISQLIN